MNIEEKKMSKEEIVINLFEKGYRLIELYGINEQGHCTCYRGAECSCAGKHPVRSNWQDNYIKTAEELDEIFSRRPMANFGIVTGNGLVVIDIDPRHGGFESLEQIKHLIEPTLTVRTGGGGLHYYYSTDEKVGNRTNVLPGIDVRGDGGFVVAPGSKHVSGNYYEVEKENKNESNKN